MMRTLRRLWYFIRHSREEASLAEELALHQQLAEQDCRAAGMDPASARAAARRQLGNAAHAIEDSRAVWGWAWFDALATDLRYGLRYMRKHPGFASVAVLALGLGIGANTAVFSLMDALLWRMLPVRAPEELVLLHQITPREQYSRFSYPIFAGLRSHSKTLSDLFAITSPFSAMVQTDGAAQRESATCELVTGNFFSALGVSAQMGRVFTLGDDEKPGTHPVTVISHAYWKRRFAQEDVIGRTIVVNKTPLTIIGVTAPEFFGVTPERSVDMWIPTAMQSALGYNMNVHSVGDMRDRERPWMNSPHISWLQLIGRLKQGVTSEQARAELHALHRQFLEQYGATGTRREERLALAPGARGIAELRTRFSEQLWLMFGMVAFVLSIACANVANLLLARAATRRKEIAVRLATGAPRRRLIRQLFTESLLLAFLGGALGLLIAHWSRPLLQVLVAGAGPTGPWLDMRILSFTLAVVFLTALLFGTAPAFQSTRVDVSDGLKEGATGVGGRLRLSRALVVVQVALSMLLVFGACLFARSLRNLQQIDAGFRRDNLLMAELQLRGLEYPSAQRQQFYDKLLARVESLPGVRAASLAERAQIGGGTQSGNFSIAGYQPRDGEELNLAHEVVSTRYFETMGMTLIAGRFFNSTDTERSTRVAVINESLARRLSSKGSALGARFSLGAPFAPPGLEVIGIVRDARHGSLRESPRPMAFLPASQNTDVLESLAIHTEPGRERTIAAEMRQLIAQVDPKVPLVSVRTIDEQINRVLRHEHGLARLAGAFGGVAIALAAVGLFGLLSYNVARRTREIGIRIALGASRPRLIGMVLGEAMILVVIGAAIGLVAGPWSARLIAAQLYAITPNDPVTIAIAAALLITVGAIAGYIPARRASMVEAMMALRE
jgi:predicted permease